MNHIPRQAVIATFVAVMVLAPILWMVLDRTPPYTYTKVEVSPQTVQQGGEIYITFTTKVNRSTCGAGLVYREFKEEESGKLHVIDPVMRAAPPVVVGDTFTRTARLPGNLDPGPVTYRGTACYQCNPLHSWLRWPVCSPTPSVTFNVVKRTEP